jgi:hypothetical protein
VAASEFETVDPRGRSVVLDWRALAHLARKRPLMVGHLEAILDAIRRPDVHLHDVRPGRERFFRRDLDPERWLRVVVDFSESPGFVVTAFTHESDPEGTSV